MFLPPAPGRNRRLAYGNYIRNLHFGHNRDNGNGSGGDVNLVVRNYNPIDKKNGLSLNDLINNSEIVFVKDIYLCSICLNEKDKCIFRKLVCNHQFHIECIEKWLSKNISCPICRYELK